MSKPKKYECTTVDYGFTWGECYVERIAGQAVEPKFQVLRVHCPNGEVVEILMRPRSTKITTFPKEKKP